MRQEREPDINLFRITINRADTNKGWTINWFSIAIDFSSVHNTIWACKRLEQGLSNGDGLLASSIRLHWIKGRERCRSDLKPWTFSKTMDAWVLILELSAANCWPPSGVFAAAEPASTVVDCRTLLSRDRKKSRPGEVEVSHRARAWASFRSSSIILQNGFDEL